MNLDAIVSELLFLELSLLRFIHRSFSVYLKYEICVIMQLLLINIKKV